MNKWRIALIVFLTLIVWQLLSQFFFCTQFSFKASSPFKGKIIYNPYESLRADDWLKCNFHAHARAWGGLTNGKGTAKDIHHAYDSLNYNIHCVSNYHSIDTTSITKSNYISAYEHGYNILKIHQLALGAKQVCWLDYIFPQTLSNKQNILNYLASDTNTLIVLNHPAMRKGYAEKDFSYLTNYHCMEVLNPAGTSFSQWDAALSAGKPIFIVGNDDLHNIIKKERLGVMCTYVNSGQQNSEQVLSALKKGRSYGVIIGASQHIDSIPMLKYLIMSRDTIKLEMDTKAARINFIGQSGQILKSFSGTAKAKYIIREKDHYARAAITYANGTSIFLNPVFYTSSKTFSQSPVYPDVRKTILYRAIGICLAGVWLFWSYLFLQGKSPFDMSSLFSAFRKGYGREKNPKS